MLEEPGTKLLSVLCLLSSHRLGTPGLAHLSVLPESPHLAWQRGGGEVWAWSYWLELTVS